MILYDNLQECLLVIHSRAARIRDNYQALINHTENIYNIFGISIGLANIVMLIGMIFFKDYRMLLARTVCGALIVNLILRAIFTYNKHQLEQASVDDRKRMCLEEFTLSKDYNEMEKWQCQNIYETKVLPAAWLTTEEGKNKDNNNS